LQPEQALCLIVFIAAAITPEISEHCESIFSARSSAVLPANSEVLDHRVYLSVGLLQNGGGT
jgi:hypothetical protein